MRCLNRAEMTLFKKQNRITVVNHAVRDIVVSGWSSGTKSNETDCDETESILALQFRLSGITTSTLFRKSKFQTISITENNFVQSISHFEKISRL